jgi:hypothetical protein
MKASKHSNLLLVASLEVFVAMKFQVTVFWVVTPFSDNRGSTVLWNIGILPHHYMVSEPRRPQPILVDSQDEGENGRSYSHMLRELLLEKHKKEVVISHVSGHCS